MAYTYPVKTIANTMRGAPQISGTAGTLIAALDAFLINGWGLVTALGVTVSGGVATATVNAGEWFEAHAVILVAGATPALLNGEGRVLSQTSTTVAWETDAPDGTATGTITLKYAPVGGWAKEFSGSNLAVYRCADVTSPRPYYRINDAAAQFARVVGYEAMADASTGTGPFPTSAYMSGGGYFHKSTASNTTAVKYLLAADPRAVLLSIAHGSAASSAYLGAETRGFGDPLPLAPGGDSWASFLSASGSNANSFGASTAAGGIISGLGGAGFSCSARLFSGLGGAAVLDVSPFSGSPSIRSGSDTFFGAAPSSVDGQIKLSRLFFKEPSGPPRCIVPGALYVPQSGLAAMVSPGDVLAGTVDLAGRRLIAVPAVTAYSSNEGIAFIDSTGPWR